MTNHDQSQQAEIDRLKTELAEAHTIIGSLVAMLEAIECNMPVEEPRQLDSRTLAIAGSAWLVGIFARDTLAKLKS